jgi:pre-rRNA-processing protein TSR3
MHFYRYPTSKLPEMRGYILLGMDAPVLTREDAGKGLFLIDATWRYVGVMLRQACSRSSFEVRSLPKELMTAYPRRQLDCPEPDKGLASIEALYAAYAILGYDTEHLLDGYHWKESFLSLNKDFFSRL